MKFEIERIQSAGGVSIKKFIRDSIENAYNRGVEDSLSKVPEEGNDLYYKNIYPPQSKWKDGFDDCRQQTIDNITKLLNK